MGIGKTSTTEQNINPALEAASNAALKQAQAISALPYAPNRGITIAGFNPTQEAAFANTDRAANAFGLDTGGGTILPPMEVDPVTGLSGYSTGALYDANLNASMTPEQQKKYIQASKIRSPSGGGDGNPSMGAKGGVFDSPSVNNSGLELSALFGGRQ